MSAYADTSFLFSLYVMDSNSTKALALVKTLTLPWRATPFSSFELENAIQQCHFRGELTRSDVKASIASFRSDVANLVFEIKPLSADILHRGSLISNLRTPMIGCRALDVLHVAAAVVLGADAFYTFDRKQARLAAAEGLAVKGPA